MSWMATERFRTRTAPDGLAIVQELVNTHGLPGHGADLLAGLDVARHWLQVIAGHWAKVHGLEPPEVSLSAADLDALRELRTVVREMLAIPPGRRSADPFRATGAVLPRAQTNLVSDERGRVAMIPAGTGANWLASAIWSEILLAQHDGRWSRVKLCREPRCRVAFYDASRNGSATWHNVRVCGNITNLRASRARRKEANRGAQEGH
ncbi:CGNR zinc finger domain-containing protein [Microbispora rosea]|uniref:CGNR zinc finger domain-containing protein n=1 Tax=Microbispora rosea TaxID=58117 RepID=UPI0037A123C6